MARTVLIAGGCGFIGSHVVDRVLRRSDVNSVVVVDNLWTGSRQNLAHVKDSRLSIEIEDAETFSTLERFDEVIHLGSPASPSWYMRDPLRVIRANVCGTLNLLNLLKTGGRFCFTSTSEVYGDPLVSPQPETYRGSVDCTGPRSSYDESKRCTEALLFESQRVYGIDIRVARLFNVYGPRTRIDDGRAVPNFITQALTNRVLTVYGDGSQSRSWGYVDDIVDGLERFFWRDTITYRGPLNIGNDREASVLTIANYIAGLVQGSRVQHFAPLPQDPTSRRPDLTRAKQVLPGWAPTTQYEDGILQTLRWFRGEMTSVKQQGR
jgi:nucleoside-diphosphate-sugar epimerase